MTWDLLLIILFFHSIEFKIADSVACGGTATTVQTGSAEMTFTTHPGTILVLSMQGKAESVQVYL